MEQPIRDLFLNALPAGVAAFLNGNQPINSTQLARAQRAAVAAIATWAQAVRNSTYPGIGATLNSNSQSIVITNTIHHVSSTGQISSLVPPPNAMGPVTLISDNGFSLASGGNISGLNGITPIPAGTSVVLNYDNSTLPGGQMWYPQVTVIGGTSRTGVANFATGARTATVSFGASIQFTAISLSSSWNTQLWWNAKSATGFTIHSSSAAVAGAQVTWSIA